MSEPLTEEQLAEIKARLAAATPGPWRQTEPTDGTPIVFDMTCGGESCSFEDCDLPDEGMHVCDLAWGELSDADAALIANAPTDIARLLAEVERFHDILGEDERDRDIAAALIDAGRKRVGEEWDRLALENALAELEATKAKLAEYEQKADFERRQLRLFPEGEGRG